MDEILLDFQNREIRFTAERQEHMIADHLEMVGQIPRIRECLREPEKVIQSKTDRDVELFYRWYTETPVGEKQLCVVVKIL